MNEIPKQFIRIWLGPKKIPDIFEEWWREFKKIHPKYNFITITDNTKIKLPKILKKIYYKVDSYAGRSDILRIIALYKL